MEPSVVIAVIGIAIALAIAVTIERSKRSGR
jgi:hypothetical protein